MAAKGTTGEGIDTRHDTVNATGGAVFYVQESDQNQTKGSGRECGFSIVPLLRETEQRISSLLTRASFSAFSLDTPLTADTCLMRTHLQHTAGRTLRAPEEGADPRRPGGCPPAEPPLAAAADSAGCL